jgi:hypothetical protein
MEQSTVSLNLSLLSAMAPTSVDSVGDGGVACGYCFMGQVLECLKWCSLATELSKFDL